MFMLIELKPLILLFKSTLQAKNVHIILSIKTILTLTLYRMGGNKKNQFLNLKNVILSIFCLSVHLINLMSNYVNRENGITIHNILRNLELRVP